MDPVEHPGIILKQRFLDPLGITPYRLAKSIGVHLTRVTRIIKGDRSITPDTAARLAQFFGVPADWWMQMQTRYDLHHEVDLELIEAEVMPAVRPANCAIGPNGVRFFEAVGDTDRNPRSATVSDELLRRLRTRATARDDGDRRQVKSVDYGNGYRAIVGVEQ